MFHCAYYGPYSTAISAVEKLAARCHFCPFAVSMSGEPHQFPNRRRAVPLGQFLDFSSQLVGYVATRLLTRLPMLLATNAPRCYGSARWASLSSDRLTPCQLSFTLREALFQRRMITRT
jgi:hypothetical protein